MSSLGTRLQRYRLENGWSKRVVARKLGVSTPSIVRWERGDAVPNDYNRFKIEQLLGDPQRSLSRPAERPKIIELSLFPRSHRDSPANHR